jgi:hypothetical protein
MMERGLVPPAIIIHKEYILLIAAPLRNEAGQSRHNDACESSHNQEDNVLPAPSHITVTVQNGTELSAPYS